MAKGPACVLGLRLVACIRARRSVAALQITREPVVPDRAGKAAIACSEKTLVPILFRQPDFEADFGIRRGPKETGDAAKWGQFMQRLFNAGTTQIAGCYRFRHGDGCIWELEMLEGGAVGGVENRW